MHLMGFVVRVIGISVFFLWVSQSIGQVTPDDQKVFVVQFESSMEVTPGILKALPAGHAECIFPDLNIWKFVVAGDHKAEAQKKAIHRLPGVRHVSEDREASWRITPDDPDFPSQWGLEVIEMMETWDITTGGKAPNGDDIVVAIFDDGYQLNHPDLLNNIWINTAEIDDNGIDDDMNGFIDDYYGWNATEDSDEHRVLSHGTAVAGIIGAVGNNNRQVAGINWDVKLMLTSGGRSNNVSLSDIVKAYNYIYIQRKTYNETNGERGAYVVVTNYSGGAPDLFPEDFPSWCEIYDLLGQQGVLNVTSAPNTDTNVDIAGDLPSTCESEFLIVVTNTDRDDQKVRNAGFGGMSVDIGAPGEEIFTTGLNDNTDPFFSGASASAPHVAGVISLMYTIICDEPFERSKTDPSFVARTIRDAVFDGADFNESLTGITTTGGRLNAFNSIEIIDRTLGNCCVLEIRNLDLQTESCQAANDASLTVDVRSEELKGQLYFFLDNGEDVLVDTIGAFVRLHPASYTLKIEDDGNDQCVLDTVVVIEQSSVLCPFGEFSITEIVPNPVSNFLTIDYEIDELKVIQLQVHDNTGRKIIDQYILPDLLGSRTLHLEVSDFPQGLYLVSIQANGIQVTEKFVVAR